MQFLYFASGEMLYASINQSISTEAKLPVRNCDGKGCCVVCIPSVTESHRLSIRFKLYEQLLKVFLFIAFFREMTNESVINRTQKQKNLMCLNASWIGQFQGICSKVAASFGVLECGDSCTVIPVDGDAIRCEGRDPVPSK